MKLSQFSGLANAVAQLGVLPDMARIDYALSRSEFKASAHQLCLVDDAIFLMLRNGSVRRVFAYEAGVDIEKLGLKDAQDHLMSGGFDRAELIELLPKVMACSTELNWQYGILLGSQHLGRYSFNYYSGPQQLLNVEAQTLQAQSATLSERPLSNKDPQLQALAAVYGALIDYRCERKQCAADLSAPALQRFYRAVILENDFSANNWSQISGRCPHCWATAADASYVRSAEYFEYQRLCASLAQ